VYDRTVKNQKLTFCVSGKLWNRSLLMMDIETRTLWSHILGQAMEGELRGSELEPLAGDMVTWGAWRTEHPKTTVLNLKRTARAYTVRFYEASKQGQSFVLGFTGNYGMHHCPFSTMQEKPLLNADAKGLPLLITFDAPSTSARIFVRKLGDRTLTFEALGADRMRDDETRSVWDRKSGTAVEGALRGKRLEPHVGIVSFARAWQAFHPGSKETKSGE